MALIDYGILRQQQQPDFVGAAEAGIRLRDLLALSPIQREQQMLQNASQALANQQQGIALSALMQRQPLDMAEAVLRNQQLQQTVSETERKAQEDAEINRIAQKYLNPQTGEMNYDGFMSELSSRFPIRANEMKGFIYGPQARYQAADFKPVGSPVKGNDGYYYQQYFDSKTKESEWRKTDFKAPEQKVSGGAGTNKEKEEFNIENKYRSEYDKKTEKFFDAINYYDRLKNLSQDETGASDLAIVFSYMKVLDPTSTVREGEAASVQNAGGVDQKTIALYNKVRKGELLTQEVRRDLVNASSTLVKGSLRTQKQIEKYYQDLAKKKNIDPQNVISRSLKDFGFDENDQKQKVVKADPKYGKVYPDGKGGFLQWTKGGTPNLKDPSGWIRVVR